MRAYSIVNVFAVMSLTMAVAMVLFFTVKEGEGKSTPPPKPKTIFHPFVDNATLCSKAYEKMTLFLDCALTGLNLGSPMCGYVLHLKTYPNGKLYDDDPSSSQNQAMAYHKWTAVGTTGVTYACGTLNYQYLSFSGDSNCPPLTLKNTVRYKFDFNTLCSRTDVTGCPRLTYGCASELKIAPPDNAAGCTFDGYQLNCRVGIDTHVWPLQCKDESLKSIDSLVFSEKGFDTLKGIERFAPMAYYDTVCAITIGYGFTQALVNAGFLAGIKYTDVMDAPTAGNVLKTAVRGKYELIVKRQYAGLCMPQEVYDALVIVSYNCEVCVRSSYRTLIQDAKWGDLATVISNDRAMNVSPITRSTAVTLISTKVYDIQADTLNTYWRCQIYHTGSCTTRCTACRTKNRLVNGAYSVCGPNDKYSASP